MSPSQQLILILFSIGLSCVFAMIEAAVFVFQESFLHVSQSNGLSKQKNKISKLKILIENKSEAINMLLLIANGCNVLISSLATLFFINVLSSFQFDQSTILSISTVVVSIVVFLICESLPKALGSFKSYQICFYFVDIVLVLLTIFKPLVFCVASINHFIIKKFKLNSNEFEISSKDEIISTAEMLHKQGKFDKEEKNMISGLLSMQDVEVSEIMTHRNDMCAINILDSGTKIVDFIKQTTHSRIPIYKEKPDEVIGVLIIKDLLKHQFNAENIHELITKLQQKPMFCPDTIDIKKQLSIFKKTRQHIAFIIDEYGGLMGLVTLEDIIEEIVGEIDDETDQQTSAHIQKIAENKYMISGECSIRDLNDFIEVADFTLDEIDTVAGLIIEKMEKIPQEKESITLDQFKFTVEEIQHNRITKIILEVI